MPHEKLNETRDEVDRLHGLLSRHYDRYEKLRTRTISSIPAIFVKMLASVLVNGTDAVGR